MNSPADLAFLSAVDTVRLVAAGDLAADAAPAVHRERIARYNQRLNAFVDLAPPWPSPAAGALAGTSAAIKESYQVAGLSWTYSSPRFRGRRAERDALPVARLREAGAAILGKTNVPELVASVGTTSPLFGPTQSPWREGFTAGGSSGGSGAAVAAGLCSFAIGDDLGGSIRMPASCCGVVGFRPAPGRVPHDAGDPSGFDSRGPLTRTVADARLAYAILSGLPPRAGRRGDAPRRVLVVEDTSVGMEPGPAAAVRRAAAALAAVGHRVDAVADWETEAFTESYQAVRRASLAAWPGEPEEYGEGVRRLMEEGRRLGATELWRAHELGLSAGLRLAARLDAADLILTPTLGNSPMRHQDLPAFLGQAWRRHVQFVLPVSYSRLPSISIPAGLHDGLPVGVMLTARDEWDLLDAAEELEAQEGFGFSRPPDYA